MVDFTINKLQEILATPQGNLQLQEIFDFNNDVRVLGLTIDAEARSQTLDGRLAVGWTVINRRDKYPADKGKKVAQICLRRLQYSCWWEIGGPINYERTMMMASHLYRDLVVSNWAAKVLRENMYLAQGLLQNKFTQDPTKGATHYMTTDLFRSGKRPSWATIDKITVAIGDHTFFAGIA